MWYQVNAEASESRGNAVHVVTGNERDDEQALLEAYRLTNLAIARQPRVKPLKDGDWLVLTRRWGVVGRYRIDLPAPGLPPSFNRLERV